MKLHDSLAQYFSRRTGAEALLRGLVYSSDVNTLYADLLRARVAGALTEADALRGLNHAGLKGELRELVVARLLAPLLPPTIGITSGVIITAREQQSAQTDVIVFDRSRIPPFLLSEKGLVPIEAVLFAIEVKSTLDLKELRAAHENAKALLEFQLLPDQAVKIGETFSWHAPISAVFAFASDLEHNGLTELARYERLLAGAQPAVMKLCVAGRGAWRRIDARWSQWPCRRSHDEVIGFLASIMNTIGSLAASRGNPAMGHYVSEN